MPRAQIETDRLLLRPLDAADIVALVALWSDPEVTRYMGGPRDGEKVWQTLEDEIREGSAEPIGFWSVVEKASGRVIGDCGLVSKDVDAQAEVELVYVFAVDAWGKGYATEAASALRDHALLHLRLPRIIALIHPENTASARVAEKVGMRFDRETRRPDGHLMRVHLLGA